MAPPPEQYEQPAKEVGRPPGGSREEGVRCAGRREARGVSVEVEQDAQLVGIFTEQGDKRVLCEFPPCQNSRFDMCLTR